MSDSVAEVVAGALGAYDAAVSICPANKTYLGDRPCPKCKAGRDEGCRMEAREAYTFIRAVRAALAEGRDGQ